jgi:hypothetical protein
MCRKGLIREKDVIQYKRNFSACKVVVSKTMEVITIPSLFFFYYLFIYPSFMKFRLLKQVAQVVFPLN